ncbi:MAG TPA: cytochrome P450 [Myxococcaceae bacterium]|jgi:cytochrome P450
MSGRLNLMTPEALANPYPIYAELRRNAPVSQVDPGGFYAVTRYDDVMAVFKNPQLFSSEGFRAATKPAWLGHNPFGDSMIVLDPPNHTRLRTLVNRAFVPSAMARLEQRVRTFAGQVVDALPLGRPVDWVESFALPLPASVIGELLGLDASLRSRFKRWADDLTSITPVTPDMTQRMEEIRGTVREAEQYLKEVLAQRRQKPADDMVTDLLRVQVDGEALTDAELMAFLFLLLVAGLETTVHLLSHTARYLIAHPEVFERVRADHSLIPKLLDEVLRLEPPVRAVYRLTTADTELSGVTIPKGSRVLVMIGSANRDETHYPDADRLDLDRGGGVNQLPFGHGVHFCLGAPLARLEGKLGLEALLPRIKGLSAAGPVEWRRSISVRGATSLPVIVHPA